LEIWLIGNSTTGAINMSIGADRIRLSFNPGNNGDVKGIKTKTAEIIDLCETMKTRDPRLAALAMTAYEEAAMWAVKLATTTIEGI
jgi:hypothetical protein